MKQDLAYRLIADQLGWTDAELADEFGDLQMMVTHKYDRYHGFQPGSRFHVSLLSWLSQFHDVEQKRISYRLLKDRLIYISQVEMHHLVSLMMPIVDRHARRRVAAELKIPLYQTLSDEAAKQRLKLMLDRTLYVGLSDGARMDVFRRYNEGVVSNEQVVAFSEISNDKWEELVEELAKTLKSRGASSQFEVVCLIDDFAGSGSSLLRWSEEKGRWVGKLAKFYRANHERIGKMLSEGCILHVHHHLASAKAKGQIEQTLQKFATERPGFTYESTYSHVLPSSIVIGDLDQDEALVALLKAWYDERIEDEHTGKDIWYGYKQCGLPLILEHNTPNNSVALLWAASKKGATPEMKPLFARRKRHSSHE